MQYIKKFEEIRLTDTALVGGKNASLGQMIHDLSSKGVLVPAGFAITAQAYWYYLTANKLQQPIAHALERLTNNNDTTLVHEVASDIRMMITQGTMPSDLAHEIEQAYQQLSAQYGVHNCDVAVRSSATAEDLPGASFAGQQETYLNISGVKSLLEHCKRCFASLFTDRAIVYRHEKGFDQGKVALSIGVQKMVRSDKASAGVAFSLDTETGFKDVVMINASYGLGELIVQGAVIPDEYLVHKPTFEQGFQSIICKKLGDKKIKMIYASDGVHVVETVPVTAHEHNRYVLTDQEIMALTRMVLTIESHYSALKGTWCPMDIEWAKDGFDQKIYIVQARPETVHAGKANVPTVTRYRFTHGDEQDYAAYRLGVGQSIGQKIVSGRVRVIEHVSGISSVQEGEIIVTDMTDPAWVPAMKRAAGIITNRGGRTCHAAIVSRELGIPALVGFAHATTLLKDGQEITLDCSHGHTGAVYAGNIPFEEVVLESKKFMHYAADILVNSANPDSAFSLAQLPVAGVGLARIEFMVTSMIKAHPMALIHPDKVKDEQERAAIMALTTGYSDPQQFFIDTLSQGVATIAAAFYPRKVIVRFSDFKSNEYEDLLGGRYFEHAEENPMLGLRGASRYYDSSYQEAFALECAAMLKARNGMGLRNIVLMVPFVRTVGEAQKVLGCLQEHGLVRGEHGLEIFMMVELPSNVLVIDELSALFDGFSIGSNDLTQLVLGVDRDSTTVAHLFNEQDQAVKKIIEHAIVGAHKNKRHIGICGQGPSDYPAFAQFLIDRGIDSVSLNADAVIPFLLKKN